jgi:hypothetical protein
MISPTQKKLSRWDKYKQRVPHGHVTGDAKISHPS